MGRETKGRRESLELAAVVNRSNESTAAMLFRLSLQCHVRLSVVTDAGQSSGLVMRLTLYYRIFFPRNCLTPDCL